MVITAVADRIPERIKALAYLDAFIPEDGVAVRHQHSGQYQRASRMPAAGAERSLAPAAYFGVNAADAATVDEPATPHLLGCFTEKLKLTGAYRSVRKHPVHGTAPPRESPFKRFYEQASSGWSAHALACGHDVMLDMPERTAELLASMA